MNWITDELKQKIKKVFEPRYKRKLAEKEVKEIAENLASVAEAILRMKGETVKR